MSQTFRPRFALLALCALIIACALSDRLVDAENVPQALVQNALEHLNNLAPTQRYYKSANLNSGYVLSKQPQVIYRLTVDLELNCDGNVETCPRETCVIDVQQHVDSVTVESSSIQCTPSEGAYNSKYVPMPKEIVQDALQDEMIIEELQKQIVDPQIQLIEEMQRRSDMIDKPFVAVKPSPQYCPGCPYELKPNVPGLWDLAEEVVSSMDQYSTSDFKYKVLEIVQVFRSVPPNSNVVRYELIIEIGNSTCLKTSLIDRSECSLQPNTPVKLCSVTIDENPLQTLQAQNKRRIIKKNNCTDSTNTLNELNVNNFEDSSATQEDDMQSYVKPEMYEYDQVAQEGKLTQAVSENESNGPVLEQASMQFMPNTYGEEERPRFVDKYKEFDEFLKDFDVPIRERSTTPDSRTPVNEEFVKIVLPADNMDETMMVRAKRQLSLFPTSKKILFRKLAQIVVDILDGTDEDNDKRLVLDVLDAKKESEDENIYHLTVKVINTKCTEKEALEPKCMADLVGPTNICQMEVEVNPIRPLGTPTIRNSTCVEEDQVNPSRKKREQLVGGKRQIDASDSKVLKYGAFAVSEYSEKQHKGPNELILVEVIGATRQVVNGMNYEIKAKIGESNCTKGTSENCHLKDDAETMICDFKVHVPINKENVFVVRSLCGENQRQKRDLVGGKKPVDVNDPDIQKYAALGISKYTELYEGEDQPVLMEVIEAKHQVVSGMLYDITVRIGESNCTKGETENCHPKEDSNSKTCLVTVWSRPWLDKGNPEVKLDCKEKSRKKRALRGANYSQKMLNNGERWRDEQMFNQFKIKYEKTYTSQDEEERRFQIFRENLERIKELQRTEMGTGIYGPTEFTDLTPEEFRKMRTGMKYKDRQENSLPLARAEIPDVELPNEYDWRNFNVVTPVKDQGSCGSCWAFSVTGNIESLYAIKHGELYSLSEQELVDCDKFDDGCDGGLPDTAYEAIESLGGLETEDEYPYDGHDEKCHFNKKLARVQITSGLNITQNETQMAQWLVKNGPISIAINANAMQFYFGGVSHPLKFLCNPKNLDHGVLIVGYGVKKYPIFNKILPYWIVKNSWGRRWGEQGYYRVYRGDGTCGVNQNPTSAVVV